MPAAASATRRTTITERLCTRFPQSPTRRANNLSLNSQLFELRYELLKELRGQQSVVDATLVSCDRPQIESGPSEQVELIENHPRALAVQAQVLLDPLRNLDRDGQITRSSMRDRRNCNLFPPNRLRVGMFDGKDDRAGSILTPVDLSPLPLFPPEVRIRDDETGLRFRKPRHDLSPPLSSLLLVQKGVE